MVFVAFHACGATAANHRLVSVLLFVFVFEFCQAMLLHLVVGHASLDYVFP